MSMQTLKGFQLSPQQKYLWLLQQNNSAYLTQFSLFLEGSLKPKILKTSLQQVINRHEILKTHFRRLSGIKLPVMVVEDANLPLWQEIDLSSWNEQKQSSEIDKIFQKERCQYFDLEQGSLLKCSLLKLSPNKHVLLVCLPAICADNWTVKNLLKEISLFYSVYLNDEKVNNDKEIIQYLQVSEWQNQLLEDEEAEAANEYWCQQKLYNLDRLRLSVEKRPLQSSVFNPECVKEVISPDVTGKIAALARKYATSPQVVLLACWQTLIWRLTGEEDILIGKKSDRREYEELQDVLGLLATWLPIKSNLSAKLRFFEVLEMTQATINEAEEWQDYFVPEPVENGNGLAFPFGFEFEQLPEKQIAADVSFSLYHQYSCIEPFKVKLTCTQASHFLETQFYYDINYFSLETIQNLARQFQALLASAVENSETAISKLEILSQSDRQQLLFEFNQTQVDYPLDKCIHQLFEEQVEKTPDNIAVVFEDQQLTYAELNTRANQLAHYLQSLGVRSEVVVGIYLERSLEMLIGILGVLKAGGAYLSLDTALPTSGLAFRLQDAQTKVLLTQKQLVGNLPETTAQLVCLDKDWQIIASQVRDNFNNKVKPENLLYVVYTSGSTGKPKGVAVEHQQLLNYLYSIQDVLSLPAGTSFAHVSTFAADLGNTVIFPSLCSGGCLHIVSSERIADPQALADYFQRHPIDCLKIVPSHLQALLASEQSEKIMPRRRLILGGEATSENLIEQLWQIAPECKIFNHYGPTETTVGVTTFEVEREATDLESATVPIGRPLANTQIYLLDSEGQPVPIGVAGEMYIGGAGLARGYLNQPELTAEKFIANPFVKGGQLYRTGDKARYLPDGNIEFLGRTDNQVKIRGFRIELGEIEAVLSQHPGVQQVVVSVSEDESGNQRLVGHIVPSRQQRPSVTELRNFALAKLPEYMVPSTFVLLKALPLTSNGKVDRRALPAPEQTRPELEALYVAPRTPIEEKLAEIWRQLLGLEKVGIYDNFFDLGGHSLLITQLLARVRDTFKVDISLHSLFKLPTVATIAKKIERLQLTATDTQVNQEEDINLQAEAVLDPTIRPDGIPYNPNVTPTAIFLTGATGFLGAFLLYELLEQTQADIYCLVRSTNVELGKKNLQNNLKSYLLWNADFSSRIIPVAGDLSQPLLGLAKQQFQLMASQIDVIYHNGALVNFTYPYQTLKAPNVLGTQEVLRLASQVKLKPVHFISTTSFVYPSNSGIRVIREEESIDNAQMPTSGYAQSKWVAEKLVTIARERGFPVCIYRPGRISGHSKTGVCNTGDHTYRMIKGCIQLGSMPNLDIQLNLSPCDYVSKAIVYLSRQAESLGKAFHLRNPQPLHLREMTKYICFLGYPLELISYHEWRSQLVNQIDSSENALYPLMSIFSEEARMQAKYTESTGEKSRPAVQKFDCHNTLSGLANSSIACPPVDAELFSIYFSYLTQIGFLNYPTLQNKTN